MKRALIVAVSMLAIMVPAVAQEPVPYAYRPSTIGESYVPSLAAIMRAVQFGHIKLAYAGKLGNWELANYELAQVQESLVSAAQLYKNIPIEKINMIDQPLQALAATIKLKDGPRFSRAFADLTASCNSCHEAARVSFITIEVPTSSPFTDQSLGPKRR
jgi:hypothetical protein